MQVGTPEFMAPESVDDPASVGPEADVYATGILAYALLTGSTPFEGCDLGQIIRAHRLVPPLPPSARRGEDMPRDLERVVLTCLAKRAGDRYADGAALLEALDACGPIKSWSAEQAERWWRVLDLEGAAGSCAHDPAPTTRRDRFLPSSTFPLRRRATPSG
jgi:serine/threonine protein kinase